jgi:hypothetical protein
MKTGHTWFAGIVFCCASAAVAAQTSLNYSVERNVKFEPGNAQMTQGLKNVEAIREIVTSGYMIAAEDLNDDKYPEIIVLASSSDFCGSAGCRMVVLRNTGPGRFETLAEHYATPDLGVTREQVNGYRLLATLDGKGGIARAGEAQKVHAMQIGAPSDVQTQLSAGETSAAFQAAGFKNNGGQWRSDDCYDAGGPGPRIEQVADLNGDGWPECVVVHESSECYGRTGQGNWLVSQRGEGRWQLMQGGTGGFNVLATKGSDGWPDLTIVGPGLCFPVLRWNGREYQMQRWEYDGKPCKPPD